MKKKLVSVVLAGAMVASMMTCASASEVTYAEDAKLKVWGSQEDQEMLAGIIEEFKVDHPEAAGWTIETAVVSSADAKNEVLKDPAVAADVFEFASDQLYALQSAGALYRITLNKDEVIANNEATTVTAATVDGEMYGYPNTSNSYFMYYDTSKYTEDEVKNLETMLAKDLGDGVTNFSMDLDNGWYTASFFLGAGCSLFGEDGMDDTVCTFNNEAGVMAGKYILGLTKNPKVANHDDALLLAGFKDGSLAASVTGTWNAAAIQESLGENFGVTTMPSFTLEDGTEVGFSTIANCNLYGVNAQTAYPKEAMLFAEYLSSEKTQKTRFEVRNACPTNVNLVADTELLSASPAVLTLTEQVKTSTNQPSISQIDNFWSPMESFGQDCYAGVVTEDNMQEMLDTLVSNILAKLGE